MTYRLPLFFHGRRRATALLAKRLSVPLSSYVALTYLVLLFDSEVISFFCREDGIFESLGALAFAVAGIFFIVAFFHSQNVQTYGDHSPVRRWMYLLLALMFLIFAGEEIDWGTRIVNIEGLEGLRELSTQGAINIHNLKIFQFSPHNAARWAFHLFWLTLTLGVPGAAMVNKHAWRLLNAITPVIPWTFGVIFLMNYVIWRVVHMLTFTDPLLPYPVNYPDEIQESNFAVLFAVVASYVMQEFEQTSTH